MSAHHRFAPRRSKPYLTYSVVTGVLAAIVGVLIYLNHAHHPKADTGNPPKEQPKPVAKKPAPKKAEKPKPGVLPGIDVLLKSEEHKKLLKGKKYGLNQYLTYPKSDYNMPLYNLKPYEYEKSKCDFHSDR